MKREVGNRKKSRPFFAYLLLVFFTVSLIDEIKMLSQGYIEYKDWLTLGINILFVGVIIIKLLPQYKKITKWMIIFFAGITVYLSIGSVLLEYNSHSYYDYDSPQIRKENQIEYHICVENNFKIPMKIDNVIPIGEENIKYIGIRCEEIEERCFELGMNFEIQDREIQYPVAAVVIYRCFGFIPCMNIINLS